MILTALEGMPMVRFGDHIGKLLVEALNANQIAVEDGDCLVIAQKIISKSEGRTRLLSEVIPGQQALALAEETGKDARFIQLVLEESRRIVRSRPGLIITEHRLGFVCANAGIDHSNVDETGGDRDIYLLLPENPDASAERIRMYLHSHAGVDVGILIVDSHGRAWRNGTIGTTIGTAGVPGIIDLRGQKDLYGYVLQSTLIAAADELAAAAALLIGEAAEGTPVVHVRGFPHSFRESSLRELIRDEEKDLFR